MVQIKEPKKRLPRPCLICETRFQPYGRSSRICERCKKEIKEIMLEKRRKQRENLKKKEEGKNGKRV